MPAVPPSMIFVVRPGVGARLRMALRRGGEIARSGHRPPAFGHVRSATRRGSIVVQSGGAGTMVEHGSLVEYEVTFRHRRNLTCCGSIGSPLAMVIAASSWVCSLEVRSRFVETVAAIACSHGRGSSASGAPSPPVQSNEASAAVIETIVASISAVAANSRLIRSGDHDGRRRRRGDDI